ncbi:hypothetical protein CONPUDRAFT_160802 [Coniophora puteana RWD-64-598 SS2]|uniref:Transposase domain-containing protein n=1 Tax=Coniophora puteana (strain RWD-64-598) TaxID=741705 RepID=R7SC29_CONPW|nr:uncharacterized protein CONPUDRAFT_160802 [Coniophora puteana RWD-64-598 SS2]EIW73721.1 hypothetical protein CONPUDRAFT_160802 [Coniophora puteana RWD-64-598 SS2]
MPRPSKSGPSNPSSSKTSRSTPRFKCICARCSLTSAGYVLQTAQEIRRHNDRYGRKKTQRRTTTNATLATQAATSTAGPSRQTQGSETQAPQAQATHSRRLLDLLDVNLDFVLEPPRGFDEDEDEEFELRPPTPRPQSPLRLPTPPLEQRWHRVDLGVCVPGETAINLDDDDDEPDEEPTLLPRAFKERPEVRNAYLRAVLANVFSKVSVADASDLLSAMLDNASIIRPLPDHPRPVRTLKSAKQRLGIDPDQYIIKYAVCPDCWKHYHPTDLQTLMSPVCSVDGCSGVIYEDFINARCKHIRKPFKLHPQVSIIASLRRMFMRPGFARMIRDSRADVPDRDVDEHFVMRDMHDGSLWHELNTHTVREVGEHGHVRDRPEDDHDTAPKLTSHRYGLHLTCNIDWMGVLENRPHSTGAMYIAINNLPREHRFLQSNVICASVMPGPKEPDVRQISHCMEPCTKEISILRNGITLCLMSNGNH